MKRTSENAENVALKMKKNENEEESKFSKPWKGSDAVLIVEEKEFHVHTQTLSLSSPVFEAMFNGNFVEAKTKRVKLEGKSFELFEHILKLVYHRTNRLGNYFVIVNSSRPFPIYLSA